MHWENLKTNNCPHCTHGVVEMENGELRCDSCYFHIEPERAKLIVSHRANPRGPIVKMKWQMLQADRCPICENMLTKKEGQYAVLKCVSPTCSFHLREDVLAKYLKDPTHPVNRFHVNEGDEGMKYLDSLK